MSLYYSAGTVTVTNGSASVTATGTAFLTNGIRAGDLLIARNQIAVIEAVTSGTALTLTGNWIAATATNTAYQIMRVDDGIRALQVASDLLATFAAGPAQGRFTNGSAALPGVSFTDQTNSGMFRPGANLVGVTVNGTERLRLSNSGVDVPAGGMSVGGSEVYRRGNLLGTVSQSAGVPTGSAMQRGSNAQGEWARFADGTQIAVCAAVTPIDVTTVSGNGFRSDAITVTLPATFFSVGSMTGGASQNGSVNCIGAVVRTNTTTTVIMQVASFVSTTERSFTPWVIGRWF